MANGFKIVIPARYGSTRLPGKPLIEICGRPMIQHVVDRALASSAGEVVVATDDPRVATACKPLGVEAMMSDAGHRSGTDRVAEIVVRRGWADDSIVVNLQGDEPCMPAALIDQVAANLESVGAGAGMATLATPIQDSADLFDPHIVKVVTDARGFALYFSRAPIPWHRDEFLGKHIELPRSVAFLRHIGLYAYRADFIRRYVGLEPSALESAESLEQLRALWHGERIHVGMAAQEPGPGVDTPDDLPRAAACLIDLAAAG